jgi:Ca-activated chloride channel family protein
MFHRMRQVPVRDVSVTWDSEPRWQSNPGRVVLSGETVHQVAGFAQHAPRNATLRWVDGAGTAYREQVAIDSTLVDGATLARVAAATRMPELGPAERHALALQYELVSPTTNFVLVHERADTDKPDQLPTLQRVVQAVPAGWGGLGTVRQGTLNSPAGAMLRASVHGAMPLGPAVWRRESGSSAPRVAQSQCDTYDIPAFLRKQKPTHDYLYRDELRRFAESMTATGAALPTTSASLDQLATQVPAPVIDQLWALIDAGFAEAEVVCAFVEAVIKYFRSDGVTRRVLDVLQRLGATRNSTPLDLTRQMKTIVSDAVEARLPGAPDAIPAWLRRTAD